MRDHLLSGLQHQEMRLDEQPPTRDPQTPMRIFIAVIQLRGAPGKCVRCLRRGSEHSDRGLLGLDGVFHRQIAEYRCFRCQLIVKLQFGGHTKFALGRWQICAHRRWRKTLTICNLLIAFALCIVRRNLVLAGGEYACFVGFLGHECAPCIALIMRAFSNAITLWAAKICASRVVSSENGRTVWR